MGWPWSAVVVGLAMIALMIFFAQVAGGRR